MDYTYAKDLVKYNEHDVQPVHIFFSDSEGTGKSHLVKIICNTMTKTLLYYRKTPKNLDFFYLDQKEYQQ